MLELSIRTLILIPGITLITLSFTPTEITALTIAFGALLTTLFTGIVNIITALQQKKLLEDNTKKLNDVHEVTKVIDGHVNSTATGATVQIAAMQKQIEHLNSQLNEYKTAFAVSAQSRADQELIKHTIPKNNV